MGPSISSAPISIDELREGDIIFLRPGTDSVSRLVVQMDSDASSGFSHVGLYTSENGKHSMISARQRKHPYVSLVKRRGDLGGVLISPIDELFGEEANPTTSRQPHIGRLRPGTLDGAAAVRELRCLRDREEEPDKDQSDFSYAKLFVVAAALDAFANPPGRSRTRIFQAAWDAALAVSARPGLPEFYCSEALAKTLHRPFALEDFPPPGKDRTLPDPGEPYDGAHPLLHLTGVLLQEDRTFVLKASRAVLDLGLEALGRLLARKNEQPPQQTTGGQRPLGEAVELLPALVTPRMIASMHEIEFIRPLTRDKPA